MMKTKFIFSLTILFLSLGSYAQTGTGLLGVYQKKPVSPLSNYYGSKNKPSNYMGLGGASTAGGIAGLTNMLNENAQNLKSMDCGENDKKLFQCDVTSDFNHVNKFGTAIIDGIYYGSVNSCYSQGVNQCRFDPDIKKVCSCISVKKDKSVPINYAAVNFNFIEQEKAAQGLEVAGKKAILSNTKIYKDKDCLDVEHLSPEDKIDCDKRVANVQKEQESRVTYQKARNKNNKNTDARHEDERGSSNANIPQEAREYNSCFSYDNFIPDSEIPTQEGINFIKYQSKINPNATSLDLDAKDLIIQKILSGVSINVFDFRNESPVMKEKIASLLHDGSLVDSFSSLKVYSAQNPYWKSIMAKDPKEGLRKFNSIFESLIPGDMRSKVKSLKDDPEVQQMIADEANKKTKIMGEVFNPDGTMKIPNSASFYTNTALVNKKFMYEGKTAPFMCSELSRSLSSEGSIMTGATSYQEKLVVECQKSYQEICAGAANTHGDFKTEDQLINEKNLGLALDYMQNDRLLEAGRIEAYLKSAENICKRKHKLDSKFKLGKNTEISREEFKNAVCHNQGVGPKKDKIKFHFKNDDEKAKACGTGSQAESILTSYYVAAFSEEESKNIDAVTRFSTDGLVDIESREEKEKDAEFIASMTEGFEDSGDDTLFNALANYAKNKSSSGAGLPSGNMAIPSQSGSSDIMGQISSSLNKAATTISSPVVDNNVQNYMQGNLPVNNIYPADFNNTDPSQVSSAKASVDKGMSQIEQRLDSYEKSKVASSDAKKDEEIALLRKQLEELKGQSDLLKAQLDKGSDSKVAGKGDDAAAPVNRSPASTDYKGVAPQVSSATQQGLGAQSVQPSKVFDNLYGDSSFHSVPTINGSKSIDSKAFTSRSSNDALLSIYTDKSVSGLVDSVASTSNSNILVVGNALEMQESTIKSKHFQTKEIVVDQKSLDQVRSDPDILKTLIEKNKMNNHEGILTLKTGDSQLNYIMRKDDAGKLVILPLNIARKVTLDNLKNELIRN